MLESFSFSCMFLSFFYLLDRFVLVFSKSIKNVNKYIIKKVNTWRCKNTVFFQIDKRWRDQGHISSNACSFCLIQQIGLSCSVLSTYSLPILDTLQMCGLQLPELSWLWNSKNLRLYSSMPSLHRALLFGISVQEIR